MRPLRHLPAPPSIGTILRDGLAAALRLVLGWPFYWISVGFTRLSEGVVALSVKIEGKR